VCAPTTHLIVDHVPEALQIAQGHLLFTVTELTVVDKPSKLLESLSHEQLSLTNHRSDAATHCKHISHRINKLAKLFYADVHYICSGTTDHVQPAYGNGITNIASELTHETIIANKNINAVKGIKLILK